MDDWKILNKSMGYGDTSDSAAAVTFSPGSNREWYVLSARVFLTTESSGATRYPRLQHRDSGDNILLEFVPDKGMGVSDTGKYFVFGEGMPDMADWKATDTNVLTTPITPLMIPKNHDLHIDIHGDASDDTLMAYVQLLQRGTI